MNLRFLDKVTEFYWKFRFLAWLKGFKNNQVFSSEKPRCFVFLAADYGNLGDVAITYAQEEYLKKNFPEYEIVDVPISQTLNVLKPIRKSVKPNDIITITGGGNMGDMYYDIELLRLLIIQNFPKNKIIVFPQTLDYSESKAAKKLRKYAKKTYSHHKNLILCAREKKSFDMMRKCFTSVDVRLTPDIVMSLNKREPILTREGALFCLRNDQEKANNERLIIQIEEFCRENDLVITSRDTHIGLNGLSLKDREHELNEIWKDFKKAKFVVTDRLHGMIFAYITGTPAIIIPNNNFKIEGCYQWVRNSGFLKFIHLDNQKQIKDILINISNFKSFPLYLSFDNIIE